MKNFESGPREPSKEDASLREQFSTLLGMFGTEAARDDFLRHCRAYNSERAVRDRMQKEEEFGGGSSAGRKSPIRSTLHNKIMETVQALSLGTKSPTLEQQEALRTFASREEVAHAIHDFIAGEAQEAKARVHEDEYTDAPKGPRSASDWHLLGKEH